MELVTYKFMKILFKLTSLLLIPSFILVNPVLAGELNHKGNVNLSPQISINISQIQNIFSSFPNNKLMGKGLYYEKNFFQEDILKIKNKSYRAQIQRFTNNVGFLYFLRKAKIYHPRLRFLSLGQGLPAVVIDKKYLSIVINVDTAAPLMWRGQEDSLNELIMLAALQTDDLRKTNYSLRLCSFLSQFSYLFKSIRGIKVVEIAGLELLEEDKEAAFIEFAQKNAFYGHYYSSKAEALMVYSAFKEEIEQHLAELKNRFSDIKASQWEMISMAEGNNLFFEALKEDVFFKAILGNGSYSMMFRYQQNFGKLDKHFFSLNVERAIQEYKLLNQKQQIDIGIIGAGYGQEPVSIAVLFSRTLKAALERENIPPDSVVLKIHVLSKPGVVFEKLKANQIYYPGVMFKARPGYHEKIGEDLIGEEEQALFFESEECGYRRSEYLNDMLEFYDMDLVNPGSYVKLRLEMLLMHNVVGYLMPSKARGSQEEIRLLGSVFEYIDRLLKPGAVLLTGVDSTDGSFHVQAFIAHTHKKTLYMPAQIDSSFLIRQEDTPADVSVVSRMQANINSWQIIGQAI